MGQIIDRRLFFKVAATGVAGYFVSPLDLSAQNPMVTMNPNAPIQNTAKNAIFILLAGAPSHTDTFDLKVGSWTPADFNPTTINGIDWPSGLLTTLAGQLSLGRFSVIR